MQAGFLFSMAAKMKTSLRIVPVFLFFLYACAVPGAGDAPAQRPPDSPSLPAASRVAAETTAHPTPATAAPSPGAYQIGSPAFSDLWVDPVKGDDARDGASQESALKTLDSAWGKIPQGETLARGIRIRILPGDLPAGSLPVYWESRYGSAASPILIQAEHGPGTVTLQGSVNMYDVHYLYFDGIDIVPEPPGDAFHCEKCEYTLIRNAVINGGANREAHETVKVNQSQHFYIEASDI